MNLQIMAILKVIINGSVPKVNLNYKPLRIRPYCFLSIDGCLGLLWLWWLGRPSFRKFPSITEPRKLYYMATHR